MIIEALWDDLAGDEQAVPVPVWHAAELGRMDAEFQAGMHEPLDWEQAKKELQMRFE